MQRLQQFILQSHIVNNKSWKKYILYKKYIRRVLFLLYRVQTNCFFTIQSYAIQKDTNEKFKMDVQQHVPTNQLYLPIPQRFGLVNIGNTCYMNAAIQIIRNIPEIYDSISSLEFPIVKNFRVYEEQVIVKIIGDIFQSLEKKDVNPICFVGRFLSTHPDYLPQGTQNDSEQFMQELLRLITRSNHEIQNKINALFQIEFVEVKKNLQIKQKSKVEFKSSTKLCCQVGNVDTLIDSLELIFQTKPLYQISPIYGLNYNYEKNTRFKNFPLYLHVQLLRFQPNNLKNFKYIDFSQTIDMFNYCSKELQSRLSAGHEIMKENYKRDEKQYKKQYEVYKESTSKTNLPEKILKDQLDDKWNRQYQTVDEGLETGYYQLIGIVTHRGDQMVNGHYMTWIKQNEEEWTKYDDDKVYQQPSSQIDLLR